MVRKLGICCANLNSKNIQTNNFSFEINCLLQEYKAYYDELILIDPSKVLHFFNHHEKKPSITYNGTDLTDINTLIIRSISGVEEPISLLARNLAYCGCDILDPIERFSGAPSGKLFDSMKGFARKILPSSYIVFDLKSADEAIHDISEHNMFPVIIKPAKGKRGENVMLAKNNKEAKSCIHDFYNKADSLPGLIIQQYIRIEEEFRGIVLGGKCLGIVKKIGVEGKIARNAAQGGKFMVACDTEIIEFIEKYASRKGLVGLDVARDVAGNIYYIESNRSPQWKNFEETTGINVAKALIAYAYNRTLHPSDLY